jgi:hypothetical protein
MPVELLVGTPVASALSLDVLGPAELGPSSSEGPPEALLLPKGSGSPASLQAVSNRPRAQLAHTMVGRRNMF